MPGLQKRDIFQLYVTNRKCQRCVNYYSSTQTNIQTNEKQKNFKIDLNKLKSKRKDKEVELNATPYLLAQYINK